MSQHTIGPARIPSPASTGAAGTFFEQHVGAFWLAHLLVRAIPPILHDCGVTEVAFQTKNRGWNTDDFLVVGQAGSGGTRKLLGQVKRTFTVSERDEECRQVVQNFWKDFKTRPAFAPSVDRLVLVTLRGTQALLEHFSGLLDAARAARDEAEFEHRLTTPGFLNAKAIQYCSVIRAIIDAAEGVLVPIHEVWSFLRVLHVLSLDLATDTRQAEAAVKTLLAHSTAEPGSGATADDSWNALLREVGEGMPRAGAYRYGDLPEELRHRHTPLGTKDHRAIKAIADHSSIILDQIRTVLGSDVHLRRGRPLQQLLQCLEATQVVLVSGAAGNGKSGLAKDAIAVLAADYFVFGFRAEEFACTHFDDTLVRAQIPAGAAAIGAVLATQGRKILLVESVERLLEASTRDAFTDLLTLVARDPGWRLVLTCRDYSTDLVRSGFLGVPHLRHAVVTVPPLDDYELQEIENAHPALARPLANPKLRHLLRNPYVLDKALQIRWESEATLPQSERDFRALFWREIVRDDHRRGGGMPRRREEAFVQVALRRARALTMFAPSGDLDPDAVEALRRDSLVLSPPENDGLLAPAHDALEDWAILRWIDARHAEHGGAVRELAAVLGAHPALRRAYRNWVGELLQRDASAADALFRAVMSDGGITAQFRDDTLVSLLRSTAAVAFLDRHREELFLNNKLLLRRVIHLLCVACVSTVAEPQSNSSGAMANCPDGPAWATVLTIIREESRRFTKRDRGLLLELVDVWTCGVTEQHPYPPGSVAAAVIAYRLLKSYGRDDEDQQKRVLKIIARIPRAGRKRFATLLRGRQTAQGTRRVSTVLQSLVFDEMGGWPAARDMPKTIAAAVADHLICTEEMLTERTAFLYDMHLELLFGIRYGRGHSHFPASAYRGPFLSLLRHHPDVGLALVLRVLNNSADWYARPRVPTEHVEPPFEITLTFPDGSTHNQWANDRLWNLHRGSSVGPDVLQSILMALERWLLEFGNDRPDELDHLLTDILKRSTSAAVTAVVTGVATAYPRDAGETLLVLLDSPWCVMLDKHRLVEETKSSSKVMAVMHRLDNRNAIYADERKEADARPHHQRELEDAVRTIQLGPLARRVHEVIDRHLAEMPPVQEQQDVHRTWRLALHRMDWRKFHVDDDALAQAVEDTTEPGKRVIPLTIDSPDPDLQEVSDRSAAEYAAMNTRVILLMWGMNVFRRESSATYDPAQWRERLGDARRLASDEQRGQQIAEGGPGYVAAVCVRDHWLELTEDDRNWCAAVVCGEVERGADEWHHSARVQRHEMGADRPCAWAAPLLLRDPLSPEGRARAAVAAALGLTHPVTEVRSFAARGAGQNLWAADPALALKSANAVALEATLLEPAVELERDRLQAAGDFNALHSGGWFASVARAVAQDVRQRFVTANGIPADAIQTFDPTQGSGIDPYVRILTILGEAPTEPVAVEEFTRLARTFVEWWQSDRTRRSRTEDHPRRDHRAEATLTELLATFLLRVTPPVAREILQPILEVVDRHPDELARLLESMISVEDRDPNTPQFWAVWSLLADATRRARWVRSLVDDHPTGGDLVSALFLGQWWKDGVRRWRSLEGHDRHVHALFNALPPSSTVLTYYVRFLYHVGEQSLPAAFVRVASRLTGPWRAAVLCRGNTIGRLETLFQRYVYAKPLELKREPALRAAVLALLDALVECGSSAAFRMRDDFVTPIPNG